MLEFTPWPKIYRLKRDIVVTEKIDGTNASIFIEPWVGAPGAGEVVDGALCVFVNGNPPAYRFMAGSRNRWIVPGDDNAGFAKWAFDNAESLVEDLGDGRHFGEWWGAGIQRKYGMTEKRFYLFNTTLWSERFLNGAFKTKNLGCVPVLYSGDWFLRNGDYAPDVCAESLKDSGSIAAPGFRNPEGIVVFHTASNTPFKYTLDGDGHKG